MCFYQWILVVNGKYKVLKYTSLHSRGTLWIIFYFGYQKCICNESKTYVVFNHTDYTVNPNYTETKWGWANVHKLQICVDICFVANIKQVDANTTKHQYSVFGLLHISNAVYKGTLVFPELHICLSDRNKIKTFQLLIYGSVQRAFLMLVLAWCRKRKAFIRHWGARADFKHISESDERDFHSSWMQISLQRCEE